jgi:hypothetical protein
MADITRTAAQIAVLFPDEAEIYSFVAYETIAKGNPVYLTSAGTVGVADANGSGTDTFFGIALEAGGAGQAISVLKRGHITGYTLSGAYGSAAYVSNTAGELADSAGSTSLVVGHVVPTSDPAYTKALYVNALAW